MPDNTSSGVFRQSHSITYSGATEADSNPRIGVKATAENGSRSVRIQLKFENQRPSSSPTRGLSFSGQPEGMASSEPQIKSTLPPSCKCFATVASYSLAISTVSGLRMLSTVYPDSDKPACNKPNRPF